MYDAVGAPAGVNDAADDGGGPAGVVEGLSAKKEKPVPRDGFRSGVEGLPGGLESGTMNLKAMMGRCLELPHQRLYRARRGKKGRLSCTLKLTGW